MWRKLPCSTGPGVHGADMLPTSAGYVIGLLVVGWV